MSQSRVLRLCAEGRSYREIARELRLSKNTVMNIVKRASPAGSGEDEAA
ncbi:helix-turn-helix domain-containing protein [Deinococcus aetherius]|nr:helix-turn-helix domain-containing protein [Deinococcus aetherius]